MNNQEIKTNKIDKENKNAEEIELKKKTEEYYRKREKEDPPYSLGEGREHFDDYLPGL